MISPRFFFLIILAFSLQSIYAQSSYDGVDKNSKKATKEYYANGKVKSVCKTKIQYPRNIDLFNFYKKTTNVCIEYDSITGKKINFNKRITKVGIGGKHCYEYLYENISYDKNGKRVKFEKSHCDKNDSKYILYVNGKKDFIHIEKSKRRKR